MRITLICLISISLLLTTSAAHATAQIPEILVDNGTRYEIFSTPLEFYFNAEHPRPNHLLQFGCTACWRGYRGNWMIDDATLWLISLSRFPPQALISLVTKIPGYKGAVISVTNADQSMKVRQRLVTEYERWLHMASNSDLLQDWIPLSTIFPGQIGPIRADWFTGWLIIPRGRRTKYVHMGFESEYERWLYIEVESGRVLGRTVVIPPTVKPDPWGTYLRRWQRHRRGLSAAF